MIAKQLDASRGRVIGRRASRSLDFHGPVGPATSSPMAGRSIMPAERWLRMTTIGGAAAVAFLLCATADAIWQLQMTGSITDTPTGLTTTAIATVVASWTLAGGFWWRHLLITRLFARYVLAYRTREFTMHDEALRAMERAQASDRSHRRTEEALRRSERRFRDIAEVAGDWIWEADTEHRFTFLSNAPNSPILGKTRWEIVGVDPDLDPHWRSHKADIDARLSFRNFRYSLHLVAGGAAHLSCSGKPIFDENGVFRGYRGTATNETEFIEAQSRASRADRLLRDAIDSISEGFVIFNRDDKFVMCNEAYREMYAESVPWMRPGSTFEAILRGGLANGQYADATGSAEEWLAERISQHRQLDRVVEQHLLNGRWTLVSERRMSDGGTAGLRTDITDLKRIQAALDKSQRRLDDAQRIARIGSSEFELQTKTLTWSNEAYRIFGLDLKDFPPSGDDFIALLHPEDCDRVRRHWRSLVEAGASPPIEFRIVRPDGELRTIRRENEVTVDQAGIPTHIVSIVQDVTETRAAERRAHDLEMQLLHSQKLEALGTLAGGIAHELNNILAPILALSKLTIEELPIDSGARADLEMVVMASERARDLVRQILAFSRKQQLDKRVIDLAAVTRRVLQMMRASLPSTIEMVDRIESVPPFFGDAGQLQQVIVNLVGNAAQAIRNGTGTVTISLAAVPTGAVAGRDELQLTVSDTGHGMDEATIDRIFEPFFTTKEVDAGTGLGLSVALGIVAEHGGCINVRSTCGKGSEFTIFLPTCELPAGEQGVGETVT